MMHALSTELYHRCRSTLLKCSEFESDTALRAVFITSELSPFRSGIPAAPNGKARVEFCLAYLLSKRLSDGRHVLPIFMAALRDRYEAGDALRNELEALRLELEQELDTPAAPAHPSTPSLDASAAHFVIVTALEEERDAILNKLPGHQRVMPAHDDIRVYYISTVRVALHDGSAAEYRVVVMPLLGMGRIQAANATADAIRRWRPGHVLLVGIAGGVADRGVGLGDVLVANQIVDYELQKQTPESPEIRWVVHPVDPKLLGVALNLRDEEWQDLISATRPDDGLPKRHVGPIASGDKVIAFADVLKRYRKTWPKLIGIEMEAGGVASAAFQASEKPGFFAVRAVSDLADDEKDSEHVKEWRLYACDVAASYAIGLLGSGLILPSSSNETLLPPPPERPRDIQGFTDREAHFCAEYSS